MSNALTIAAVTAVLKDLLENSLVSDLIATSMGDVTVTALPPDRISVGADERAGLNLFLYQVTRNRNADRGVNRDRLTAGDSRSGNPPLALDLHYLLTAYGAKDFQAELLLGSAMQLLHEMPILTRDIIYTGLKNAATVNTAGVFSQAIATISVSELAEQLGQIKICPEFFNMEETSKLWSALQTHYRPSAAYQASMVLLEDRYSKPLIPVCPQPSIEKVTTLNEQRLVPGNTLVIYGKQLRGEMTRVRLIGVETLLVPQTVKETQISLPLPSNLHAGVQGVQVVHQGIGKTPQVAVESNVAAFVVHSAIAVTVTQVQNMANDLHSAEVSVKFSPKVGSLQRVVLLLNEVSTGATVYSFIAQPRNDDTELISFLIEDVKTKSYLVRVRVDGAESLSLSRNGEYDLPHIKIP